MILLKAECSIYGENFSPAAVEKATGLKFAVKNEPNEMGSVGRYANKPIPYGASTLESDVKIEQGSTLDALLDLLEQHASTFRKYGAEDIVLHCDVFHDGQCNFEFSPKQVARIAKAGVALTVSCYEDNCGQVAH